MYEIAAIRTAASDDATHEHVELVGYNSRHIEGEQILIPIERVGQRLALGEEFWIVVDGEKVPVTPSKCETCGHEPVLKAAKGSLLDLPRK